MKIRGDGAVIIGIDPVGRALMHLEVIGNKNENIPPEPAPHPANCLCGPWVYVNKHWTFIVNPRCPIHGN